MVQRAGTPPPGGVGKVDEADGRRMEEASPDAASVLERMLSRPEDAPVSGTLMEASIASWADADGTLADGHAVRLGASCLLRPAPGDRVLIWSGGTGERWVLTVLERTAAAPATLASTGPLTIRAPRVAIAAEAVHIQAQDFLTSTRNRHAVEHVGTETVQTRVAQIGTDIRRAGHATDEVEGTLLQRAGTWISNTLKEARLHARAFLFD